LAQSGTSMNVMIRSVRRFLADEDGLTAVEYAMLALLLILVLLTGITWLGQATATRFEG
jgi:pilus assembly protein Flp/PilA